MCMYSEESENVMLAENIWTADREQSEQIYVF